MMVRVSHRHGRCHRHFGALLKMNDQVESDIQTSGQYMVEEHVPTAGEAVFSLILGVMSFLFWVFCAAPAVILGVIALNKVSFSEGRLRGNGLAIAGICTGIAGFFIAPMLFAALFLWPYLESRPKTYPRYATPTVSGSIYQLKHVGLAMHNYHDVHGTFPVAGEDEDGEEPKLSWRVHLLPYLEGSDLYDQFHLDEPWDSEHNKTLIPLMPEYYVSQQQVLGEGKTTVLAVTGPDTVFRGGETGIAMREIIDGTASTILVVEADASEAVIWTKPDDWKFDPKNPTRGLGSDNPSGFSAIFADGSVQVISDDTYSLDEIAAFFTRHGGEIAPGR